MEKSSYGYLKYLNPPGEIVDIPYENGATLPAYFVRAPFPGDKLPVLICMGGLDSIKDEMWFMQAHGCLQRGISVLMIDGPGQGGALRRQGLVNRPDTEVPIGYCIDYLETRNDVDVSKIAVCGSSLGGIYAARAACYEHRLAACISHGAVFAITDMWGGAAEDHGLATHIKWVFGCDSMKSSMEKAKAFTLDGHLENMQCPYLIMHGGHDVLTVSQAKKVYDYGQSKGVNCTLRLLEEEETGAEHCQHDNPTIGQEILADWLADQFGIDQAKLLKSTVNGGF
jgi:pimeloyl-ACP methyl ester carboxylesterase